MEKKLRVASYYEDWRRVGRNDGAPLYATHALRQLGHEVDHIIPDPRVMGGLGKYGLHLFIDFGHDALRSMLDYDTELNFPTPKACWLSDTHLGYEARRDVAKHFQGEGATTFCMQKRAVEEMKAEGLEAEWLPHAFEPLAYPRRKIIPKYDVCFVGHINSENRIDFLDRMFKEFSNFFFGKRLFEAAAEKFNQSKIVLNISIKDDINMRVFETLGTGSFLLTNEVPTLHELFEDGKHLVTYKTLDEAVDKARYYIAHDSEREKIAQAGYEEVMAKHTYKHRVEKILETIKQKELTTCQS